MADSQGTDVAPNKIADRNLVHIGLIIVVGILATTMPQPQTLGKLPLQHILKDTVHVDKTQMASFFFLCGLAWYFKPIAGILTDAFPLFKTRRRAYLLISSVLAGVSWIALGFVPHTYAALLWGCIIVNAFMVMASTVVGAYLVEAGQALGATGRLSSLRMVVQNATGIIQGPLSGFLATGAFMYVAGVSATAVVMIFPIAYFFLKEHPVETGNREAFSNAGAQLKIIGKSKTLWLALIFIGLFYFSPGFTTPLFYKQTEELKFSLPFIGTLGSFASVAALTGAALYGFIAKKINLRTLLTAGIAAAATGTLLYLLYSGKTQAMLIDSQSGFFGGFAEVALMDLAARATPKGCEGLGYSLILSIRNVALFGADIVGSMLSDHKWPFSNLVFLNAGTTAIVLILIPFLPTLLMNRKDELQAAA